VVRRACRAAHPPTAPYADTPVHAPVCVPVPPPTPPHGCLNNRFACRVALTAKTTSGQHSPAYPAAMHGKATASAGAAIVLAGCGGSSQTTVTLTSTLEITKSVTVTARLPPSAPKTTMETDGTYRVGITSPGSSGRRTSPRWRSRRLQAWRVKWDDLRKQIKKACDLARKHGAENVTVLATMIGGRRPTPSACSPTPRTGRG
jgi:hypothetical protein